MRATYAVYQKYESFKIIEMKHENFNKKRKNMFY